jgi:hypothetical protein
MPNRCLILEEYGGTNTMEQLKSSQDELSGQQGDHTSSLCGTQFIQSASRLKYFVNRSGIEKVLDFCLLWRSVWEAKNLVSRTFQSMS